MAQDRLEPTWARNLQARADFGEEPPGTSCFRKTATVIGAADRAEQGGQTIAL